MRYNKNKSDKLYLESMKEKSKIWTQNKFDNCILIQVET